MGTQLSGVKLGHWIALVIALILYSYRNIRFNKPEIHLSAPLVLIKFPMYQKSSPMSQKEALGV